MGAQVLDFTVLTEKTGKGGDAWVQELADLLKPVSELKVSFSADISRPGHIVFIHEKSAERKKIPEMDRRGRAIFLVMESDSIPAELEKGWVDDVIVRPFRMSEVLSRLRHYQQILLWDEVHTINESFNDLIERLKQDLRLAERIQKSRIRERFKGFKGFNIQSRYLAGLRSGGDFFDVVESDGGKSLSLMLSDSSTHGLSSAFLSVLMNITLKLRTESLSLSDTVGRVYEEIRTSLEEGAHLSLLFGSVSRRDLEFRYFNLGTINMFRSHGNGKFQALPRQGQALKGAEGWTSPREEKLMLRPGERLVILSDGFSEGVGGEQKLTGLLDSHRQADSKDLLNELTYQVKSGLEDPEDFPAQDCSALVLEVDEGVLRVVKH